MHTRQKGRYLLAILLLSLGFAGAGAVPVAAEAIDCGYGETGPTLAHATGSFKILDYECAASELEALLNSETLTRPARADAYMLLGAVLYAQMEDNPARDERVTEQFANGFRTFPQWRGEPHFAAPHYRSLIAEAKANVALESGPMLAAAGADPLLAGAGNPGAAGGAGHLGANTFRRWVVGVGFGAAIPTGDFKELADGGLVFGIDAGYFVSRRFALGFEINPHSFQASADVVRAARLVTTDARADARWTETQVTAFGKYLLSSGRTSPFVRFQMGSYRLEAKIEAAGGSFSSAESNFGFGGGAGVQFRGDGLLGGFVEATFHDVPSDGSSLTFFDLRGGLSFSFGH